MKMRMKMNKGTLSKCLLHQGGQLENKRNNETIRWSTQRGSSINDWGFISVWKCGSGEWFSRRPPVSILLGPSFSFRGQFHSN